MYKKFFGNTIRSAGQILTGRQEGYLLPVVLVLGLVLTSLATFGLAIITSNTTNANNQIYDQVANDASKAGLVAAQTCLGSSSSTAGIPWSTALTPAADCTGSVTGSTKSAYVLNDTALKITSTYTVTADTPDANGATVLISKGTVSVNGTIVATKYSRKKVAGVNGSGTSVATPTDPYASSVVALLRGDGPNGSTVISDSSPLAANWSSGSNVTISNMQAKFGGTSIKVINGSSYLIPTAASSNFSFGTGDFTIELWYYTTNGWGACYLFDFNSNSATLTQPAMLLDYTVLRYYVNGTALIESPAVTTNQWVHLALTRSNGQTRLFLDGNQVGSTSSVSYNVVTPTSRPTFSSAGYNYFGSYGWDGYLDNIRITKGVARYTANFTPPTTSF